MIFVIMEIQPIVFNTSRMMWWDPFSAGWWKDLWKWLFLFPKQIGIFVDLSCTWICSSPFTAHSSRAGVAVIFCGTQTAFCASICKCKKDFGSWLQTLNTPAWGSLKDSGCHNHAIASYKDNILKINSGGNAGKRKPNIILTQMFYSAWNE